MPILPGSGNHVVDAYEAEEEERIRQRKKEQREKLKELTEED